MSSGSTELETRSNRGSVVSWKCEEFYKRQINKAVKNSHICWWGSSKCWNPSPSCSSLLSGLVLLSESLFKGWFTVDVRFLLTLLLCPWLFSSLLFFLNFKIKTGSVRRCCTHLRSTVTTGCTVCAAVAPAWGLLAPAHTGRALLLCGCDQTHFQPVRLSRAPSLHTRVY